MFSIRRKHEIEAAKLGKKEKFWAVNSRGGYQPPVRREILAETPSGELVKQQNEFARPFSGNASVVLPGG